MSEWDRRRLLELIDEANGCMKAEETTDDQRRQIRALMDRYVPKSASVLADARDVSEMKEKLFRVFKP